VSDGVRDPRQPFVNGKPNWISGEESDKGFDTFNLKGTGTLKQKMNRWKKGTDTYEVKVGENVLVDYVDRPATGQIPAFLDCDRRPNGATPAVPREQRVPQATTANSFYACVNSTENYVRIYLRGNALARLENKNPPPSYTANNSAYFPTMTIQVKGNGFLFTRQ
jgi:hypothetical protein